MGAPAPLTPPETVVSLAFFGSIDQNIRESQCSVGDGHESWEGSCGGEGIGAPIMRPPFTDAQALNGRSRSDPIAAAFLLLVLTLGDTQRQPRRQFGTAFGASWLLCLETGPGQFARLVEMRHDCQHGEAANI